MLSGYRKESVISDVTRTGDELPSIVAKLKSSSNFWTLNNNGLYPFSKVLRLRVLQIVCGISVLVMGAVACIEEKGKMTNLALGMPAGFVTVIAAGASIHMSHGFGGYRTSRWGSGCVLRVVGPSPGTAAPLALLWTTASALHAALIVQSILTIKRSTENNSRWCQTRVVVAGVEVVLSAVTVGAVLAVLRVDWSHDPD